MTDRQQRTFATTRFDRHRKPTRRERFLREMDKAMPWRELIALIQPCYTKEGQPGRSVTPREWMIKLYFLQIWFGLSDPETEELMHDSYAAQQFLGLDLGRDSPPDETTILRFRHLTEEHDASNRCDLGIIKNLQYALAVAAAVNIYRYRRPFRSTNARPSSGQHADSVRRGWPGKVS